jgi:hypothetical protein
MQQTNCATHPVVEPLFRAPPLALVALLDVPSANVCTGSHDALWYTFTYTHAVISHCIQYNCRLLACVIDRCISIYKHVIKVSVQVVYHTCKDHNQVS